MKRLPELLHRTYSPDEDLDAWMTSVAGGLGDTVGIRDAGFALITHTTGYTQHRYEKIVSVGPRSAIAAEATRAQDMSVLPPSAARSFLSPRTMCTTQSEIERRTAYSYRELREARRRADMGDVLQIYIAPEPGLVGTVWVALSHPTTLSSNERVVLGRIGLHLETALRLRLRPEAVRMVFDPNGRILHDTVKQGDDLKTTVRKVERARPDAASRLAIWTALVRGKYSLVEREDRGKRLYLALENPPESRARRRLTSTEVAILRRAARALSGKMIAYSLGLSTPAVSMALSSAATKLGVASPIELAKLVRGLVASPTSGVDDAQLSPAEREVLALLLEGKSNLEIAEDRGRSERTVANQVASLLRKTGSPSRRALRVLR